MKAENLLLVERAMKFMPWTVQPSDSVAHARALLDEHRINHLPVLLKGKLVGVVSTRDVQASKLSRKAPAIKRALETHPDRIRVASVMTTTVHIARPSDTLGDAADLMRREHVGALPVIEQGHLRGIISRAEIVRSQNIYEHSRGNHQAVQAGRGQRSAVGDWRARPSHLPLTDSNCSNVLLSTESPTITFR